MSTFPLSKFIHLTHNAPSRFSKNQQERLGLSFFDNSWIELFEEFKDELFTPLPELGDVCPLSYYFFTSKDYLYSELIRDFLTDSVLPFGSFNFLHEFDVLLSKNPNSSKTLKDETIKFILKASPNEILTKWDDLQSAEASGLFQSLINLEFQDKLEADTVSNCVEIMKSKGMHVFSSLNGYNLKFCQNKTLKVMIQDEKTNVMSKDINGYSLYDYLVMKKEVNLLDLMNQLHPASVSSDLHESNVFFNDIMKLGEQARRSSRGYKNREIREKLLNLITSKDNAFELVNAEGENVLMVLARAHIEVFSDLEEFCKKKKAAPYMREGFQNALEKTDAKGRGVGFYMCIGHGLDKDCNPEYIRKYNGCRDGEGDDLFYQALKQEMEMPDKLFEYDFPYYRLASFCGTGKDGPERISRLVEGYFIGLLNTAFKDGGYTLKALKFLSNQKDKFLLSSNYLLQESMRENVKNLDTLILLCDLCELNFKEKFLQYQDLNKYYNSRDALQLMERIKTHDFGNAQQSLNELHQIKSFEPLIKCLTYFFKNPAKSLPEQYKKAVNEKGEIMGQWLFSQQLKNTIKKTESLDLPAATLISRF